MGAQTYTCRCRFCGYTVAYDRHDAGREIACARCSQSIRLPGKLATVSSARRARRRDPLGLALEAAGLILLFLAFPWGLLAGGVLLVAGWKRCGAWVCENCQTPLKSRDAESCPGCHAKIGLD